jgi:hypothetical protein
MTINFGRGRGGGNPLDPGLNTLISIITHPVLFNSHTLPALARRMQALTTLVLTCTQNKKYKGDHALLACKK